MKFQGEHHHTNVFSRGSRESMHTNIKGDKHTEFGRGSYWISTMQGASQKQFAINTGFRESIIQMQKSQASHVLEVRGACISRLVLAE
jgi:hypothetical protein